jgi:hypothetical protein
VGFAGFVGVSNKRNIIIANIARWGKLSEPAGSTNETLYSLAQQPRRTTARVRRPPKGSSNALKKEET